MGTENTTEREHDPVLEKELTNEGVIKTDAERLEKSPYHWDSPHTEKPDVSKFHPVFLLWLVKDMWKISKMWMWHKKQSLTARREYVTTDLGYALRELERLEEHVPPAQKGRVKKQREHLLSVADELNIEESRIESYRREHTSQEEIKEKYFR